MKKSSGKWVIILAVLAIIALGAVFIGNQAAKAGTKAALTTADISRGDIESDVLSSADLQPAADLTLTFGSAGVIADIDVKPGDVVTKGQLIASLDPSELNLAITQAQANLNSAKAKLDSLKTGTTVAQQSAAKLKVTQAQSSLDKAKSSASLQEQQAQLSVNSAQRAELNAQDKYNTVAAPLLNTSGNLITGLTQDQINSYNAALRALDDAKDNHTKAQLGMTDARFQAQQNVATAQAQLDDANTQQQAASAPAQVSDQEAAQSSVDQAQANLDSAKLKLQNAKIAAPFAGVIASVPPIVGQTIGANATIAELVDTKSYHLDMNVGETDIGQIKLNQPVDITFDAIPGLIYTGTVTYVAPIATVQQGVVSYLATVTVDPKATGSELKPGMSASASVIVDRHTSALLVPNRAVRTEGRQKVVYIVGPGGAQVRVPVQTGISNDTSTEIMGDTPIREGDAAIIPATTTTTNRAATGTGGILNFGGGTGGRRTGP